MKRLAIILFITIVLSACNREIPNLAEIQETVVPAPTVIKADGLPNKHLIKTPFIPQAPEKNWSQPWQDACEEASLLTVYYYSNNQKPSLETILSDYEKMFMYESDRGWTHDVNLSQMSEMSRELLDIKLDEINNVTTEVVKQNLAKDLPVIITANGKTLYKENKHFKSGGPWYHSLVILGYDDDKNQFIVHDVGTQFGEYFHYSYSIILESIHDFPLSGLKEDIDSGDKKALVLVK